MPDLIQPGVVENVLETETIQYMNWTVCSPDLNITDFMVEHASDTHGRCTKAKPMPLLTLQNLEIEMLQIEKTLKEIESSKFH